MTPAVQVAKKAKIKHSLHRYDHDPSHPSYGLEAAEKLGLDDKRVFKTLVAEVDQQLTVAILPVSSMLNLKLLAKAVSGKKAAMADKAKVEKTTGYVLGGVSPLGQKRQLPTVIDASAQALSTIYVSAGKRGLEIELAPADLAKLTGASFAELTQE